MMPPKKADISIVIPFYNRRAQVASCLTAVVNQFYPLEWNVEIIAVDNGSTDGTLDALAAFPVRVVKCDRRGPAAARNAGIDAATGDIIAFTDSDCIPEKHWLALLMQPFSDPDMLATGGRIVGATNGEGVSFFTEAFKILNQMKFFRGVLCFPPFFATANCAYQRKALKKVAGFDDSLVMSEDADLTWRVMDLGGKIAYCPDAVVNHVHRQSFGEFFNQAVNYGFWAATVFARHRDLFCRKSFIEWDNWTTLSVIPIEALLRFFFARTREKKVVSIYDMIWRAGFTWGKIKGSINNRVLFL